MKTIQLLAGIIAAAIAIWLLMTVALDAWDKECDYREDQAKRIVSYGVVR